MISLNKREIVKIVAGKTRLTQKDTETTINALLEAITEATINDGERVSFSGFGSFTAKQFPERTVIGVDGNSYNVPARHRIVFKAY